MNILTTDPVIGWKRFKQGLAAFFVGLLLLLVGSEQNMEVLYLGSVVMICGFTLALAGYIPMLMHRLTSAKRLKDRGQSKS